MNEELEWHKVETCEDTPRPINQRKVWLKDEFGNIELGYFMDDQWFDLFEDNFFGNLVAWKEIG